jgi:hypothetical protein
MTLAIFLFGIFVSMIYFVAVVPYIVLVGIFIAATIFLLLF